MRYLRSVLLLLLVLAGAPHAWAQTRDEAAALFYKANELYKQEKYDEAVAGYEDILKKGLASWTVYYDLGNSYFKKGRLGRAVLNYTRAKELEPRDADLRSNYSYALSQMNNDLILQKSLWGRLWDRHLGFYTADEMLIIIFALLFFLALIHLCSLYMQWPAARKNALLGVFLAGIVIFGYGFKLKLDQLAGAGIAIERADVKYEPLENATIYFELPEGSRVKMLKAENGWVKIEREDGKLGWVKGGTVEKL